LTEVNGHPLRVKESVELGGVTVADWLLLRYRISAKQPLGEIVVESFHLNLVQRVMDECIVRH
jgi:hypothetical protein